MSSSILISLWFYEAKVSYPDLILKSINEKNSSNYLSIYQAYVKSSSGLKFKSWS